MFQCMEPEVPKDPCENRFHCSCIGEGEPCCWCGTALEDLSDEDAERNHRPDLDIIR